MSWLASACAPADPSRRTDAPDRGTLPRTPVGTPAEYFAICAPLAAEVDIWETEYLQVLTGKEPVKEWTEGTWLKPFLDALPEPPRAHFEADYARRVARAYPPEPDGRTLLPLRRLFIVARKAP